MKIYISLIENLYLFENRCKWLSNSNIEHCAIYSLENSPFCLTGLKNRAGMLMEDRDTLSLKDISILFQYGCIVFATDKDVAIYNIKYPTDTGQVKPRGMDLAVNDNDYKNITSTPTITDIIQSYFDSKIFSPNNNERSHGEYIIREVDNSKLIYINFYLTLTFEETISNAGLKIY